ncbi:MAG: hypothetical protein V1706_11790 [Pseudomonadota bacterium]
MKKPCKLCNGTGQSSTFKGVSRFLLSWEECPECAGLGYTLPEKNGNPEKENLENHKRPLIRKRSDE